VRVNLHKYSFILILGLLPWSLLAQEYNPEVRVSKDRIKLGEQFTVTLILEHSPTAEIVFPDSTYNFSPLELIEKKAFTTKTSNNISVDSVFYLFTCFEDQNISFKLPIFEYKNGEKNIFYTPEINLSFESTLPAEANNLEVIDNTNYQNVLYGFDYIKTFSIIGGVLALLFVLAFLFKNKILRAYENYRLKKLHERYLAVFEKKKTELSQQYNTENLEKLIFDWKTHITKIGIKNFNTLSTREIATRFPSSKIKDTLMETDKAIYGNILSEKLLEQLDELKIFAEKQYQKRKEAIEDGKK
jgi:hypothetical protein